MNKPKIFLSYSWEDKSFAKRLEADLESAGADVWIDYSGTRAGDNLPERISEALEWCDTLLLIWSKASENSSWVKLEWTNAIALGKKIIPCILSNNRLPAILKSRIYVNFHTYELGLNQLLRSLLLHVSDEIILEQNAKVATEKLALRTREGYYIRAVNGGGDEIVADVKEPKASAIFTLEWLDKEKSKIRLKTRDGYYIHAVRGGGDNVDAKIIEPKTSEEFTLEWVNKEQRKIRIRTRDMYYLHAIDGGGGNIDAKIKEPKTSEVFTLILQK